MCCLSVHVLHSDYQQLHLKTSSFCILIFLLACFNSGLLWLTRIRCQRGGDLLSHLRLWVYLLAKQCAADTTQQVWMRVPAQKLSPIYIAAVQGWDPGKDEDPPTILGLTKLLFLCLLPHGLLGTAKVSISSGTAGLLSLLAKIKR